MAKHIYYCRFIGIAGSYSRTGTYIYPNNGRSKQLQIFRVYRMLFQNGWIHPFHTTKILPRIYRNRARSYIDVSATPMALKSKSFWLAALRAVASQPNEPRNTLDYDKHSRCCSGKTKTFGRQPIVSSFPYRR